MDYGEPKRTDRVEPLQDIHVHVKPPAVFVTAFEDPVDGFDFAEPFFESRHLERILEAAVCDVRNEWSRRLRIEC